ncbi:hypothetical protein FHT44_004875 [Mycolicibacterium sp. BK634]|nr:hypothetical protein [Mycolicibacterium sp. BK634]
MIHRLKGNQCQPTVDGDLGERGILYAVWPPQNHLPLIDFREIFGLDFGKENDVAVGQELGAGADSTDKVAQRVICGSEVRAIAVFEEYPRSQRWVDPAQMCRMDRQTPLILLAGASENAQ